LRLSAPFFAVVLVSLLLPSVAVGAAPPPRDFIGVTAEDVYVGSGDYRAANLETQASIGIGLIRQTFDWAQIESAPGRYELGYQDGFVGAAASHGITILPVIFNPPEFRLGARSGRATCPPANLASMAAYAQALVRRYGPNGTLWSDRPWLPRYPIRSWQIWNEPNLGVYWCNRPSARKYVKMLRVVGAAIKQVDPAAKIVTAGLPPSKLSTAVPLDRYLRQMYRAHAERYFDSLAINSYAKDQHELGLLLGSIRRLMNRRGDRRGTLWITELGWSDTGPPHRFVVGPEGQAGRIARSLTLIRKRRRALRLRGLVYFAWRDSAPYPPQFKDLWGLHTGLLDLSGAPKPAFYSFGKRTKAFR